jgi:hypothetical protein
MKSGEPLNERKSSSKLLKDIGDLKVEIFRFSVLVPRTSMTILHLRKIF